MEKLDTKLVDMRETFDDFKRGFNDPQYMVSGLRLSNCVGRVEKNVCITLRVVLYVRVGATQPVNGSVFREPREPQSDRRGERFLGGSVSRRDLRLSDAYY